MRTSSIATRAQQQMSLIHLGLHAGIDLMLRLNSFTATLAAPSLGKRPSEVPNLKSRRLCFPLRLKGFLSHERISIKMRSIESRFVIRLSHVLYVCTFQPGNFTSCGSEGVNSLQPLDFLPASTPNCLPPSSLISSLGPLK